MENVYIVLFKLIIEYIYAWIIKSRFKWCLSSKESPLAFSLINDLELRLKIMTNSTGYYGGASATLTVSTLKLTLRTYFSQKKQTFFYNYWF